MEQFYDKMSSKNEIGKYAVDDFVMKKIDVKYLLPGGKSPVQMMRIISQFKRNI